MTRAVVLGSGIVGSVIAADLAADGWEICVLARSEDALAKARALAGDAVETSVGDLSAPAAIRAAVRDADVVLGALPGALGYAALRAVIEARVSALEKPE